MSDILKPDYGKMIKKLGYNNTIAFYFYGLSICHISVVGSQLFSLMLEKSFGGEIYAISFDYDSDIFCRLLGRMDIVTAKSVAQQVNNTRQPITIELSTPVIVDIECYLGEEQQGQCESFIPLRIARLL